MDSIESLTQFYRSDAKLLVQKFGHADLLNDWRITPERITTDSRKGSDGFARSDATDFLDDFGARLQYALKTARESGDQDAIVKADATYRAFCNVSDALRKKCGLDARDERTIDEMRAQSASGRAVVPTNGKMRSNKPRATRTVRTAN